MKKWYLNHKDTYAAFHKQADGVGKGNLTFVLRLIMFAKDCIPMDKLDVCNYIFQLNCGDVSSAKETPDFIRKYDKVVEDFLQGGKIITVSATSGEVKCFTPDEDFSPEQDVCVICNEEFERIKADQPELLRCYLNDLYEQLDDEAEEGSVRSSELFFDEVHRMAHIYAMILTPEVLRNMVTMGAHTHDDFPY